MNVLTSICQLAKLRSKDLDVNKINQTDCWNQLTAIDSAYERLIALLNREGADYRLIDHPAEGRTELVSRMRGHAARDAAKCMIVMLKIGKKTTKFILAVIPGDARVDLDAIKRQRDGTFARIAEATVAETLTNCVTGTILPFAFDPKLELVVDPSLTVSKTIYFNAARLDRSVALETADYLRIAKPKLQKVATES